MMSEDHKKEHLPETFEEGRESDDLNVRDLHASIVREKDDPRDGFEPIPLWLVSCFMALVFWGGAYLAYNSGGFQSTVFDPAQKAWGPAVASQKAAPDPKVVGKRLFTANCVACHQSTGLGVAGQFPPLVGSEWVLGADGHGDNHVVAILLRGLQGPVQVKGTTYNGAMPPWTQLTDDQIAAILTYIRSEWGNSAGPITADQVAKMRAETQSRTQPWTQGELMQIPPVKFEAMPPAPAPGASPAAGAPTQQPAVPSTSAPRA